ncbi:MAG: hypothetical protein R3B99_06125 [Polyangiales bacterium]
MSVAAMVSVIATTQPIHGAIGRPSTMAIVVAPRRISSFEEKPENIGTPAMAKQLIRKVNGRPGASWRGRRA